MAKKLVLFVLSMLSLFVPTSQETIHVVAPVYKEYSSVGMMINAFFAQTSSNWTLTFVSDGKDDRMEHLVRLYSSIPLGDNVHDNSPDGRISYMSTPERFNDGGHSPRSMGLASLPSAGWTVLSGGDNYYCPLFVESLLEVIDENERLGFIYWDFVLDRKGNQLPPPLTKQNKPTSGEFLVNLPIVIGGVSHELSFNERDDLQSIAVEFATRHGLEQGGGCEAGGLTAGTGCVATKLVIAMQVELERALNGEQPAWKEVVDRYEGYESAELAQGKIDVGAFAFPSSIGQEVGYNWRHHSADWSFASHVLQQVERMGLHTHHIKRTLYVHN